ncbi:hypothetical protein [uncultured Treponema sp.]|uniref:hypothetical protein n=1 Tax=uncultured Treponema sp. TaxID=162155 RepID=UPI0025DB306B|nr:hypothetical protein [uncultured Treponema sp.]
MKSDICKLSQDKESLALILAETEKAAAYNNLEKKETGRLRLLAEELVGMLPELLSFSIGEFWVESNDGAFELHTSLTPDASMTSERREKVLAVSSSGKNAAATGIMNKIRLAAEFMMLDYVENTSAVAMSHEFYEMGMTAIPVFSSVSWSLDAYRKSSEQNSDNEKWDELEKSIIANIADDVVVGVQGKKVDIIVKKTFKK